VANADLNFTGTGAASFTVFDNYSVFVTGNVASDQSITMGSQNNIYFTGPLTNAGTITWTGAGTGNGISVTGGTFTNTGTIEAESGGTAVLELTGTFDNQSTGEVIADSSITLDGTLTNEGSLSTGLGSAFINAGTLDNSTGTIDNAGTLTSSTNTTFDEGSGPVVGNPVMLIETDLNLTGAGAANFTVNDSTACFVTGNVASDQSITLGSQDTIYFTGPLTNAGTITWTGAGTGSGISMTAGTFTNTGTIEAEPGGTAVLVLTGTFDNQATGEVIADSSVTLYGTLTNEGSLSVAPGTTFINGGTLDNGTGTIANAGTLEGSTGDTFTEGSGPITGNPVIVSEDDLILSGAGQSSFVAVNSSVFVTGSIEPLQTLTLDTGTSVYGLTTNQGTLDSQPGSGQVIFEGPLVNDGTFKVGSGSQTNIYGSFTQGSTGSLQIDIGDSSNYGRLVVNGNSSLAGELITQTSGFVPTIGSSFDVINSTNYTLSGTFTTTAFGSQPYTTQYTSSQLNLFAAAGMEITTTSLPAGQIGVAYTSPALTSAGAISPISWTLNTATLPPGLVLNPTTGVISGAPTSPGTYSFTVSATDSSLPTPQVASANLTIVVGGAVLAVTTSSLPVAQVGEPYLGGNLVSSGGTAPIIWAVTKGKLPAGLSIAAATGVLSGTPTKSGVISFTVTATDSSAPKAEVSQAALSIDVASALNVTTKSLSPGQVGIAYPGSTLASSGGTAPVTWAVTSGSLPAGLTLNAATGAITGTPTGSGATSSFSVTATDSSTPVALSASATLSIKVASPALNITTLAGALLGGQVGVTYPGATLAAAGGTAPLTWTVSTGSLPPGLTLNGTTGAITGTPTVAGNNSFTVTVTDSSTPTAETAKVKLSIAITAALTITTASLPAAQVGTAYSAGLTASGGLPPLTWSVTSGKLPTGLSLTSATGVISGTPSVVGASTFTVTVTDSTSPTAVTAKKKLSFTVNGPTLAVTTTALPAGQFGVTYPGATLASTGGTAPLLWAVTSGSLPVGLKLNTGTGAITGTPSGPGMVSTFTVTVTDSSTPVDQTASATLFVAVASAPLVVAASVLPSGVVGTVYPGATLSSTGGTAPITWLVSKGSLPKGLSLTPGSGAITGTPTASGISSFTVTATDSSSPTPLTTKAAFTIAITAHLAVTTGSLSGGEVGIAYPGATLASTGGTAPVTWSLTSGSLPSGTSLAATTGAITGTPTAAGTFTFTVTATDSSTPVAETASANLSIAITGTKLSINSEPVLTTNYGVPFSYQFTANGGVAPYTWSIVPKQFAIPGLTLNPSTGVLSGTVIRSQVGGTSLSEITVTDSAHQSVSVGWILVATVITPLVATFSSSVYVGSRQSYSAVVQVSGGVGPYAYTVSPGFVLVGSSPGLPPGMTLNSSTGVISGQPTEDGTWAVVIVVSDSETPAAIADVQIEIQVGPPD
jgi:hypothetical protein